MLDNLTQRLSRVVKTIRGEARLTEANTQDMLREVRMALLEADVALPVVREFIARVKEKALGQEVADSLNPGQALVGVVHRELMPRHRLPGHLTAGHRLFLLSGRRLRLGSHRSLRQPLWKGPPPL